MAKKGTKREIIFETTVELLDKNPEGLRYSELKRLIGGQYPSISQNTIGANLWDLDVRHPELIYKPEKGFFRHTKYKGTEIIPPKIKKGLSIKEEEFYEPFSEFLINEIEECTKAIPLGGKLFKDKWGTPDVIGINMSRRSDIIEFPTEIISVEIKYDNKELITAFGQVCAYKLFSHKCYLVIPSDSLKEDISKLDALCLIFGIGLVLFNRTDPKDPQFEIRTRSRSHEPDRFQVNKYLKIIEKELFH